MKYGWSLLIPSTSDSVKNHNFSLHIPIAKCKQLNVHIKPICFGDLFVGNKLIPQLPLTAIDSKYRYKPIGNNLNNIQKKAPASLPRLVRYLMLEQSSLIPLILTHLVYAHRSTIIVPLATRSSIDTVLPTVKSPLIMIFCVIPEVFAGS